jgi:hypothetical protein
VRVYSELMSFPWLSPNLPSAQAARRTDVAVTELRARAAVYYRLGFTAEAAAARLAAAVGWEFDPPSRHGGPHVRPKALGDAAIAQLVRETFARHPS